MQSDFFEVDKNSLNNNTMESCAAPKDTKSAATKDEHQSFNDLRENEEDLENNVVYSDSDDGDQFINSFEDEYDVQLSSPPSSRSPSNSDNDQRWYAYRGRWGINLLENQEVLNGDANNQMLVENRLALNNQQHNHAPQQQIQRQQQQQQQQQQEEEETDFLEMDFEPDTNSEIENENEARFANFDMRNGQLPIHMHQQQQAASNEHHQGAAAAAAAATVNGSSKSTGAKPKQFAQSMNRNLKSPKSQQQAQHATYGDNVFRITGHLHNNEAPSASLNHHTHGEDVYNVGASCSSHSTAFFQNDKKSYQHFNQPKFDLQQHHHHDYNNLLKPHKSPSKSSHHSHKQQRLHEEQNDQFLFELEPIKPRNSVTIYTSNCDEKILMDALTSLKLKPDREMIKKYFNNSRPSSEMKLVDYIIYRSKMSCNYLKLIELIERACKNHADDEYGTKKFDINFYPLDFFSTTPEMIDVEVNEIVKRWTPQTDLSPLVRIKNKYFVQTNVLGKLVNIIRRINNQKPLATFKENETIKIPQFYVSGYITITSIGHPT